MNLNIKCTTDEQLIKVLKKLEAEYPLLRWRSGSELTTFVPRVGPHFKVMLSISGNELTFSECNEFYQYESFISALEFLGHGFSDNKALSTVPLSDFKRGLQRLSKTVVKVMYNPPATIVWFGDGDKIVSKADKGDKYDWKHGLALCILKKRMPKSDYNRFYPYFDCRDIVIKRDANGKVCRDEEGKFRFIKNDYLWDVLVRKYCPNGEWEKIKKEWKR